MRSLYRRHIKISLLTEAEKEEAHGWANTTEGGVATRHYFKADQARFVARMSQTGVGALRLQLERLGIYPESITIKHAFSTFTYKNLGYNRERQAGPHHQAA
jgi:hypothetical protein